MKKERPYQKKLRRDIMASWENGSKNTLAVLPTGGGKTWVFSEIIARQKTPSVTIAHRQEIVIQISLSLAAHGVKHRIIAPNNIVKLVNKLHMQTYGRSYYHPSAVAAVAGVDTLIRKKNITGWCESVGLWVQDEAHHMLQENKWGKAAGMFPNALGLGVTATPLRADGKGLGRHADGLFDDLVTGPGMRELMATGYLSDYRIFAPESDLDLSDVKMGVNGDYTRPTLKKAVRRSQIIGDVVKHYKKFALGKQGVTFASDVETATHISEEFNTADIPAEIVSAKTPATTRFKILQRFRAGGLRMLVNVDLFGEGFDLPAIEVVIMARPTASYQLFAQQFGRALRPQDSKSHAIIIDHVGNVVRHGLPDRDRIWTLDKRERRKKAHDPDVIPVKACPFCTAVYERVHRTCPYCQKTPKPMSRSGPEFVDGDLTELDAETLARMRGDIVQTDLSPADYLSKSKAGHLPHMIAMSAAKKFKQKQEAQVLLRESIALWAGYQRADLVPDSESYRRFYFKFGVDVLTAQTLGTRAANDLASAVDSNITQRRKA